MEYYNNLLHRLFQVGFCLYSMYSYTAFHTQQNVCGIKKKTLILFIQEGRIKLIKSVKLFIVQQICKLELISEGSCDTKDWNKFSFDHRNKLLI